MKEIIAKRVENTSDFIFSKQVYKILESNHPRFVSGTLLDFGFMNIASDEGYKITLLP